MTIHNIRRDSYGDEYPGLQKGIRSAPVHVRLGFLFILLSLLFQSGSVVFGKFASLTIEGHNPFYLLLNPYYLLTILCLFLQAITWQQTLRHYPLAWSYMFMSGIYPVILLSSYFIFNEHITVQNIIGALIIVAGVLNLMRREN
jgi:multidrug transporter EmrE-like cation transporter